MRTSTNTLDEGWNDRFRGAQAARLLCRAAGPASRAGHQLTGGSLLALSDLLREDALGGPPKATGQRPVLPGHHPFLFSLSKLVIGIFIFVLATTARAEVSVTANLSSHTTTVDEPVRLTVTINGARNANLPAQIQADGLEIDFRGKSQQFQMSSSIGMAISTIGTYLVTPQKPGKFTIPSVTLEAGGKSYSTEALTLTVEKGLGGGNANDGENSKSSKIFAELIIPKETAYVGEVIPVEVRFYFEGTINFQLNPPGQVPQIGGEGFSKLRFPQPRLEQKTIDGTEYRVLAYQTGLVAAKSGEISIGPASLNFVVSMPQKRRARSLFNDPFADDLFNNSFFGTQTIQREMTVHTDPGKLRILSLPSPKPPGFAGAVGQFTLSTSAKPAKVKVGDPITLTTILAGKGNFDLVTAPALTNSDGWRTYPATGKLNSTDEIGVVGEKTFETALIPERQLTEIPAINFIYFDPAQEKYITLEAGSIPVQVEGNPIATTPKATPPTSKQTTPIPQSSLAKTESSPDLPLVRTTLSSRRGSFEPIWKNKLFLALQSIPLLLLAALLRPKIVAAFAPTSEKVRLQNLHQERNQLVSQLKSGDPAIFFPAAARHLEITAALAAFPAESSAAGGELAAQLGLSDDETEIVREIFRRRDELTYGGGRGGKELTSEALRRYHKILGGHPTKK